ncbi:MULTISPECIES: SDR family oxidoreductase [unclassified Brenneria]|uniref:SDR family oxidoreductase n=1 Tax=unclassified Brenneria TaxID=2634434 RepID=UPI0015579AB6|nr:MULTISPECIES: SDR family oxidoreductase [unclassified Brenneria]MBJ7222225.1 SDR family oxidoreductase [Brenneria sp. L3-3C-1]MEE3643468.1 SDR family oxidoreductase [Brenneria sp. L3_3C_1]MEE3651652.1 SDR family oxidoreductase [Brenneria sp. HEZEL_4_2_4]NPD01609.1 SDR family oxidoreductase [Brenneria sp. hezel4-2-4]
MIAVTGASGQLGRLVIAQLLDKVPANEVVALVRDTGKVADLAARGVQVKAADYNQPAALAAALQGVDKVLLISSSEVGKRALQHRNVIEAAVRAGVKLLAYTSILHADTSPLRLATEHQETEAQLKASGLPYVLLRNGWYTENYAASIPVALQHGVFIGSAGEGKIASATRADYAAAAVAVLTQDNQAGKVYELAGDEAYTLAELAAEVSRQSGKTIGYRNLPPAEFSAALAAAGIPEVFADIIADSDVGAAKGGLFDDGHQLSRLIGRATTPLATVVKGAI